MTPEAAVAQLAASLLAHEIDASILASLQQPDTAKILTQIEPSACDLLEQDWAAEDFETAAVEFCRLFILNPAAPARAGEISEKKLARSSGSDPVHAGFGVFRTPGNLSNARAGSRCAFVTRLQFAE